MQDQVNVTEELKRAAEKLYFWQHSYTGCFSDNLFNLFQKADPDNFRKLSVGFPLEAIVFAQWYSSESSDSFFKKYNII